MNVCVTMTAEDFLELVKWTEDREFYQKENQEIKEKLKLFARKVCWAMEPEPKRAGKVKIADQEHAVELVEMAKAYLE